MPTAPGAGKSLLSFLTGRTASAVGPHGDRQTHQRAGRGEELPETRPRCSPPSAVGLRSFAAHCRSKAATVALSAAAAANQLLRNRNRSSIKPQPRDDQNVSRPLAKMLAPAPAELLLAPKHVGLPAHLPLGVSQRPLPPCSLCRPIPSGLDLARPPATVAQRQSEPQA